MSKPATELDWNLIPNFSPGEWPLGVLDRMDATVIQVLQQLRSALPADHAMTPSPLPGAHVRDRGTSRHSTAGGRLADATDIFMRWEHAWAAWLAAVRHPKVGGIGFYPDMMLRGRRGDFAMLHFDCRPQRIMWVGWRRPAETALRYVYHHHDPAEFYRIMGERGKSHG
jgi:hypothetical protein